ncbi:MAG: uncharacterized protein QOD98_4291 [Nocardioidaceae bacterium]|nr:uncharacterized protein [Nocardioidaceae bacterium]
MDHVPFDLDPTTLAVAMVAAFLLAVVSAIAGFGGGVVLLPVFVALFGLRVAVPVLTLTQLASNGSRVALNRRRIDRRLVGWFALGAVPCAVGAGLVFATAPLAALERLLGVLLVVVVVWRRLRPRPPRLSSRAFVAVGAASGLGSALLGSVGPLTAPFFLARGLVKDAYIGTEAASAVVMHAAKLVAYGVGALLTVRVLVLGAVLAPATMLGAWVGRHVVRRISEGVFVVVVEIGLLVAAALLLVGV